MWLDFWFWHGIKIKTDQLEKYPHFKEGEIFYAKIGRNIGYEQYGKGDQFIRPVLVVRKFNRRMFWGVPLTRTIREGLFFHTQVFIKDVLSTALLSQMRILDAKRLVRKVGAVSENDLQIITEKIKNIFEKNSGETSSPAVTKDNL